MLAENGGVCPPTSGLMWGEICFVFTFCSASNLYMVVLLFKLLCWCLCTYLLPSLSISCLFLLLCFILTLFFWASYTLFPFSIYRNSRSLPKSLAPLPSAPFILPVILCFPFTSSHKERVISHRLWLSLSHACVIFLFIFVPSLTFLAWIVGLVLNKRIISCSIAIMK